MRLLEQKKGQKKGRDRSRVPDNRYACGAYPPMSFPSESMKLDMLR